MITITDILGAGVVFYGFNWILYRRYFKKRPNITSLVKSMTVKRIDLLIWEQRSQQPIFIVARDQTKEKPLVYQINSELDQKRGSEFLRFKKLLAHTFDT